MRGRKFPTQKHAHNVRVWTTVSALVLVSSLVSSLAMGDLTLFAIMATIVAVGYVVSIVRDKMHRCTYLSDGRVLMLKNWNGMLSIDLSEATDASLIDRMAAREYIQQKTDRMQEAGATQTQCRELIDGFVRYCSVDIGMKSFSLGIGTAMTDRMRDSRSDLVLLRLKSGDELLLSPVYSQVLVSSINKAISSVNEVDDHRQAKANTVWPGRSIGS